jgi:hypothetical protein
MGQEQERRDFIRVPFKTATTVRIPDRTLWSSSTLDLSMNGIRIATEEAIPLPGTPCEIEMVLSEDDPAVIIEARGSIVRSAPGTLAVHFSEVDFDSYLHLRQLIMNNADDPDQAEQQIRHHWGIRKPGR